MKKTVFLSLASMLLLQSLASSIPVTAVAESKEENTKVSELLTLNQMSSIDPGQVQTSTADELTDTTSSNTTEPSVESSSTSEQPEIETNHSIEATTDSTNQSSQESFAATPEHDAAVNGGTESPAIKKETVIPKATTDINEWMPDKNLQAIVLSDLQDSRNGGYNITSVDQITLEMVAGMKYVGDMVKQYDDKEYFDASTHVVTLKGLEKATNLESIEITSNLVYAIKWYGYANMDKIYGQLEDISALKDLTKLRSVIFQFNRNLSDISALANKPEMSRPGGDGTSSLSYCGIYDISPLRNNGVHPNMPIGRQLVYLPGIKLNSNALKNGFISPSFIISNLDGNNVPIVPLNPGDAAGDAINSSAATGTNINDTTVKWTNFTKNAGYLTVRFDDPFLGVAGWSFDGWVMQPFEIDDTIGNVNVDYRLDSEDGTVLNPSTILAGNLGDTYDVTKEESVNEIDAKLQQKYYFKEIIGEKTGTYSDSLIPTVTYVYSRTPVVHEAAPIHVTYVDEAGKEISDGYDITGKIGDTAQVTKKDITGYTFKEYQAADDANGSVTLSDKERTVKVVYTKDIDNPTDPVKPTNPSKPDTNNSKPSKLKIDKPSVKQSSEKLPQTGENKNEAIIASALGVLILVITGYMVGKKRKMNK